MIYYALGDEDGRPATLAQYKTLNSAIDGAVACSSVGLQRGVIRVQTQLLYSSGSIKREHKKRTDNDPIQYTGKV